MAMLKDSAWVLELIGDGPLTESVKNQVRHHGLEDRVVFSGLCKDVPLRLARSDIFVLASEWEGLPLSILEAMRANLPVVASDVGGVAESVDDGKTGFLVPKGNRDVFADCLGRLLGDDQLRKRMGLEGRGLYEREFSFELMYQRTLEVYRGVLMPGCA
jgi:glycosyltransferase involved in cell wall biosynthesis